MWDVNKGESHKVGEKDIEKIGRGKSFKAIRSIRLTKCFGPRTVLPTACVSCVRIRENSEGGGDAVRVRLARGRQSD